MPKFFWFFLGGGGGGRDRGQARFPNNKGWNEVFMENANRGTKKTKNAFGDAAGVDSSSIHMSLGVQIISEEKKSSCKMGST